MIGGGWRAQFFVRIARDLPAQFPLVGIVLRQPEKRAQWQATSSVPVFATAEELCSHARPGFVVTSVPRAVNLALLESLAGQNVAVLSETPLVADLDELPRVHALAENGARIQVAEQYLFQPLHAARLKLVRDGRLDEVHEADVSVAHGYHGVSLLRHYLGVGLRLPRSLTARKITSTIVKGPDRAGAPSERSIVKSERTIVHYDFGEKFGIYDFCGDQYISWIRSNRLLVRGEQGEINQKTVRLLENHRTPIQFELVRRDTGQEGNHEGYSHRTIVGGSEILYENPFPAARWSDDEIPVATSLQKMGEYVATGQSFYSVAEACQDQYLDLLAAEAISSGNPVAPLPQPWTDGS
jgi:predicted dehydrogenase